MPWRRGSRPRGPVSMLKRSLKASCHGPRPSTAQGLRITPSTSKARSVRGVCSSRPRRSPVNRFVVCLEATCGRTPRTCRAANILFAAAWHCAGRDRRAPGVRWRRRPPDRTSGRLPWIALSATNSVASRLLGVEDGALSPFSISFQANKGLFSWQGPAPFRDRRGAGASGAAFGLKFDAVGAEAIAGGLENPDPEREFVAIAAKFPEGDGRGAGESSLSGPVLGLGYPRICSQSRRGPPRARRAGRGRWRGLKSVHRNRTSLCSSERFCRESDVVSTRSASAGARPRRWKARPSCSMASNVVDSTLRRAPAARRGQAGPPPRRGRRGR